MQKRGSYCGSWEGGEIEGGLRIKVIPTLALVKDGKTQDFVVGFSDLGNTDDFTTETLEWRLGCSDILNYR